MLRLLLLCYQVRIFRSVIMIIPFSKRNLLKQTPQTLFLQLHSLMLYEQLLHLNIFFLLLLKFLNFIQFILPSSQLTRALIPHQSPHLFPQPKLLNNSSKIISLNSLVQYLLNQASPSKKNSNISVDSVSTTLSS